MATYNFGPNQSGSVRGNNNTINCSSGDTVFVAGTGDTINITGGGTVIECTSGFTGLIGGMGDTISLTQVAIQQSVS